ncbi:sugar-binding domain-containing protein [Agaribacter marinus]|uniref:Beta-galactosidase n=1 Tax=Agaribacter marinus TaxID=1431249 RepID=A0AA37T004_9ALTE|nr:sugar-binding domain-containing protein [Agaribacter marinus]GLR69818.1 beta-galactosidase [Agaribacter marinus]
MKNSLCLILLLLATACTSADTHTQISGGNEKQQTFAFERNIPFDFDWQFHLGDVSAAKGAYFDDKAWQTVDLPHDYSITGEYSQAHPAGWRGGFLPTGVAWYRKNLEIPSEWKNKRIILRFDGVYLNSDVWVNGQHVGHRPNGYVSFSYDITKYLKGVWGKPFDSAQIAVRVDHEQAPTGRWYTGSGIYRHVWLDIVDQTFVPKDGVFARTGEVDFDSQQAQVLVDTEVHGAKGQGPFRVQQKLFDADGKLVANASTLVNESSEDVALDKTVLNVRDAKLWSTTDPYLYSLHTEIFKGEQRTDLKKTRVGIRTIDYTVDKGFLLNNEPLELEGMSFHHDGGPVGAAVPDDMWRRRLMQLKEMGMNSLRPAHTPFAPIFYDLADEMGFLVMNEAFDGWETEKADYDYGLFFEQWWQIDLEAIIKRDRSHPSIIMWSIGNEVIRKTSETQEELVKFVKALDDTRPITQGRGYMLGYDDIAGFNGHGEFKGFLEEYHEKYPKRTMVGTEITHTLQTRGVYRTKTAYRTRDNPAPWEKDDPIGKWNKIKDKVFLVPDLSEQEVFPEASKFYDSSYDNAIVRMNIRDEIKLSKKLPYLLGTYRWTAFDYLGESFGWPARTANFGIIDLAGFEKDGYYLYQSQWSDKPMVHVLPHWTHPGKEGVEIPMVVYTNLDEAEMFLNGTSLGTKAMTDDMQIVWQVPYTPGEIEVVARSKATELRKVIRTSGKPSSVNFFADKSTIQANKRDVVHVAVDVIDKHGVMVPNADSLLSFSLEGPGKIIGIENGDILDHSHHVAPERRAFNGKVMVLIQATDEEGDIRLSATSDGLVSKAMIIHSVKNTAPATLDNSKPKLIANH